MVFIMEIYSYMYYEGSDLRDFLLSQISAHHKVVNLTALFSGTRYFRLRLWSFSDRDTHTCSNILYIYSPYVHLFVAKKNEKLWKLYMKKIIFTVHLNK